MQLPACNCSQQQLLLARLPLPLHSSQQLHRLLLPTV
jgi:hypothetical protein